MPSAQPPRWIRIFFFAGSLAGFADAAYLAMERFANVAPPCSLVSGCETVTLSAYSTILGIPVALLGAIFYLLVLVLSVAYFNSGKEILIRAMAYLSIAGLIAGIWFVSVQTFILNAFCIYCLFSAAMDVVLFAAGIGYFVNKKKSATMVVS